MEHCTQSDGFTLSEAVTGTPTTNDYFKLTFPKFRTLEKFTYRNVSPFNADMSPTMSGCSPTSAIHFVENSSTLQLFKLSNIQTLQTRNMALLTNYLQAQEV